MPKFFKMKRTNTLFHVLLVAAMFTFGSTQAQKAPTAFGKTLAPESINPENGFVRCITNEYEKHLQDSDSSRMSDAQFEAWIAPYVDRYKTDPVYRSENAGIITIPVVVHVIHSGQAVGVAPNITDSQVLSQITAMNNDYRKMAGTRGANSHPAGADTMIQFALAKSDPDGNPTNGVNHVNLCQESWSTTEINTIVKPTTIWDPMQYLNMWSVNFSDASLLGYAQFPSGSGLPGMQANGGPANSDGVVSNYATFGSSDFNDGTFIMSAPYDKGRTMTHEVGHWLGLRHIWGDSACGNDYCADTPTAHTANYNCNPNIADCDGTGVEMVQNYMDYTNDTCMNIFTQDQKARMVAVMNNSVRRMTLKTSTKDQPIALFATDAKLKLDGSCTAVASCEVAPVAVKAYITNVGTSPITSAVITYTFNNGAPQTFTFTGNIAPTNSTMVSLPFEATDSGVVNATITTVNGTTDQRITNNTSEGIYLLPTSPIAYEVNKVQFNLKRDNYASETTWNLKNAAGTILYSGGPWTNQNNPPLLTEEWTLPADGCYVFTINDSYGDGLIGSGYYNIKTLTGQTIAAGGQFGNKQTKVFATAEALGTNSFDAANTIQLYPNPTRNTMTISVSNSTETPDNYSIYNTIGQQISSQKITSNSDLTINTSALSTGVYFIKLSKGTATKTLRFIKE